MADKQTSSAKQPQNPQPGSSSSSSSFLGGGPKFNQAGMNAPLPGEPVADVPVKSSFLNTRALVFMTLAVVLVGALWVIYGRQPAGVHGGRAGVSINGKPSDDPDAPPSMQQ